MWGWPLLPQPFYIIFVNYLKPMPESSFGQAACFWVWLWGQNFRRLFFCQFTLFLFFRIFFLIILKCRGNGHNSLNIPFLYLRLRLLSFMLFIFSLRIRDFTKRDWIPFTGT